MADDLDDSVPDSPHGDVIETVSEYDSGFSIRFCDGPRGELRWQAGVLETEYRSYHDGSMTYPFRGHVSLFHLRGYGNTRHEALEMARKNPNRRNGR